MMRTLVALSVVVALAGPASADPQDEVRALYETFAAAQNARDLGAVRAVLSDSPDFLWISDGRPVWGREAMLERMAGFQKAEVWRVEPEYEVSRVVMLDGDTAVFHVPLVLVIGSSAEPARLKWLVEVLCQREDGRWRIAGLFTAEDKRN
jgi:uncharacterized protein (TIGR02246 family)